MSLFVVHCKKNKFDVYIGRPSKWGNPFSHRVGAWADYLTSSREESITKYEEWLHEPGQTELLASIGELKGKVLGCWCKPLACHGDVLARLANEGE